MDNVTLVKGYVQDTFPKYLNDIGSIGLLHLDMDFYKATIYALETLYDKVIVGGYIVIDDYNAYKGCKKAVHEFIKKRGLDVDIVEVVETNIKGLPRGAAAFWKKK